MYEGTMHLVGMNKYASGPVKNVQQVLLKGHYKIMVSV